MSIHYIQKYDLSKYSLKNFGNVVEICSDTNAGQALKFNKNGTVVTVLDSGGGAGVTALGSGATSPTAGGNYVLSGAAGGTVSLPAATGSGKSMRFAVTTVAATNPWIVQAASATDYFRGQCFGVSNADGTAKAWQTANTGTVATESDQVKFLSSGFTAGGNIGDIIEVTDIATAIWRVTVFIKQVTTEVTPFAVGV